MRDSSIAETANRSAISRLLLVDRDSSSPMRLEIQALRALAVCGVVLYHMTSSLLPGGFVGVDVFFVISGYLIIGHIFKEVADSGGNFSVVKFWARRVRRLLPASTLVLVATVIAMFIWVPNTYWADWLNQIVASLLYVQNWLLAANSIDYLASQNLPSAVEHYWSLSAEEQFYIVWPLLILAVLLLAKRMPNVNARKVSLALLVVVTAASFVYSVALVAAGDSAAYFVSTTRAWEFSAGGLLAYYMAHRQPLGDRVRTVLAWLGIGGIGASYVLYSGAMPFPGAAALLPVISTALVILAGFPRSTWGPQRIYRLRSVQWLGDISYSFYLWHMPLLVIVPYALLGKLASSPLQKVLAVLVALALAAVTRAWVEKPFVSGRVTLVRTAPRAFAVLLVPSLVFVGINLGLSNHFAAQTRAFEMRIATAIEGASPCVGARALINAGSCANPFAPTEFTSPAVAINDVGIGVKEDDLCKESLDGDRVLSCNYGDTSADAPVIALVGDSHAGMWLAGLDLYGKKNKVRITTYLKTYCPGIGAAGIGSPSFATSDSAPSCATWGTQVLNQVKKLPRLEGVVFANFTSAYLTAVPDKGIRRLQPQDFDSAFAGLQRAGIKAVVLRDVARMSAPVPACVAQHENSVDPCAEPAAKVLTGEAADPMIQAAKQNQVAVVDMNDTMCTEDAICHVLVGGIVTRFDDHHISASFSRSAADALGSRIMTAIHAKY